MCLRKLTVAMAAGMLAAALVAFPASAHGHGHYRQAAASGTGYSVPVCTVEGCTATGRHSHNGYEYCGYGHSSGYCDRSCAAAPNQGYGGYHCH